MNQYLVLDLETQKWSEEVTGGWNNIAGFGLAIAVTMTETGGWAKYSEKTVTRLIESLNKEPLIITFNGINFDYEVLRPYGLEPELLYTKSFDILHEMRQVLGHRVSLESVARATLGEGKSGSGLQAVQWWKEGKVDEIIKYCRTDVDITRRIYEFIQKNGYANFMSLQGEVRTCLIRLRR